MPATPSRRTSRRGPSSPAPRAPAPAPDTAPAAAGPRPATRASATGILLRFISCGLVSLAAGLAWKLTLAPDRVSPASALAGLLFLLSGFILGGVGWYIHDVRLRLRAPDGIDDERLVFSFIVFAVVPFMVLVLVGLVWLLALLVGAS